MATCLTSLHRNERNELKWFLGAARAPRIRTMRAFAEQEIVIPDGPFQGRRFRCDRQPYTAMWFDAIDSGRWNRFCATGPTQSGKTLAAFVVPTLYHLFELGETVICAVPDLDMSGDKWREDFLPAIERTKYRDFLPRSGAGSKGGRVRALRFRNGATLRFMSGGGGDKARAGFTARVLVVTETDGMDEAGGTSREADKIAQLEGRTRAYGSRKRVYLECTVSIAEGRTWREYQGGTASKIYLPCPHCGEYVFPERDHLAGWQGAATEVEASAEASYYCPACGEVWSEKERARANLGGMLVHRGQEIEPDGTIRGEAVETNTLGFRWSAPNNLFLTAGDVGVDEWKAAQALDEDNAEKELRQFVWALPYEPPTEEDTPLDPRQVRERFGGYPKGEIPTDSEFVTLGVDLGAKKSWWLGIAWRPGAAGHIFDYGQLTIRSDELGVQRALLEALRAFHVRIETGWLMEGGGRRVPDQVWVDSNYQTPTVKRFCREVGFRWRPILGRGASMFKMGQYKRPERTSKTVIHLGEQYHVDRLPKERLYQPVLNADYWKSWAHARLATPIGSDGAAMPGAMTLYHDDGTQHDFLSKHLTAEKPVREFVPDKGWVHKWVKTYRHNHWLDCTYIACAAGHFCGVRLEREAEARPVPVARQSRGMTTPDGRPYLVTER